MPSEGFRKSGILAPEHRDNNVGAKWLLLMLSTASATGIAMCHIAVALEQQRESAYGYKQTSSRPKSTSALPPKADIFVAVTDFRF